MCTLTKAASKYWTLRRGAALASAFACLALSACGTPLQPDGIAAAPQPPAQFIAGMAEYAAWLSQRADTEVQQERARLEQLAETPERNLRLALICGLRNSSAYDPKRASQLLIRIATAEPQGSIQGQLAQLLFTSQPDPNACAETERLNALSSGLAGQLEEAQVKSHGLETQLEAARKELESEKNERARLESQLKALKSLEAQIKGRDGASL